MIQARMGELWSYLGALLKSQANDTQNNYDKYIEAVYTERNNLKEKLIQVQTAIDQTPSEQSKLDRIFAVTDDLFDQPLDWDEQMVWHMVECIKVIEKDTLGIRFRWGEETEVMIG